MSVEDRKRLVDDNPPQPDHKKPKLPKVLDQLSEPGEMLTQNDIVFFKKEAIWRQMNHFKSNVNLIGSELEKYKSGYAKSVSHLSTVNEWIDQLVAAFLEQGFKVSDEINDKLVVDFDCSPDQEEGEHVSQLLEKLREKRITLIKLFTPLLNSKLGDTSEDTAALKDSLARAHRERSTLIQENKILNSTLKDIKQQYLDIVKVKDRLESKSLSRINGNTEEGQPAENNIKLEPSDGNDSETISTTAAKTETNGTPVNNETTDHDEDLQNNLEKVKLENSLLLQQLQETQQKLSINEKNLHELNLVLNNLSGDMLLKNSVVYSSLYSNYNDLEAKFKELQDADKLNVEIVSKLQANNLDFEKKIVQEFEKEKNLLQKQLAKNEQDLARIRSNRDELLSQVSMLKAEKDKDLLYQELQKLIDIQNARIDQLSAEKQVNEFEDKGEDRDVLLKKIQLLLAELKDIEAVFKKTREIESEKLKQYVDSSSVITKLTTEKNKADQKYFATMRLKDSLAMENKLLKTSLSKSKELIDKNKELIAEYQSKVNILQNELLTTLTELNKKTNVDISTMQKSLNELINSNTILKQQLSLRDAEVENKSLEVLEKDVELKENKRLIESLKFEKEKLTDRIQRYRETKSLGDLDDQSTSLESFRKLVYCDICERNFKKVAVTTCGHTFCKECIDDRINSRMRKCPNCNKPFSKMDVLEIHL